ncbi:hypothetical protein F5Y16DRAFT_224617 [Xylariaceae sp. FL0255]|nr:hypothetical protein F5Y16DRAFT_224617 [Xylariaceae sp. FL0255]
MSRTSEPEGHQNWPAMEADYWQTTKRARDREDSKLAHEYGSRQEHIRQRLIELTNTKLELEGNIRDIVNHINFHEAEKARLHHEYESRQATLVAQRHEEDLSQQRWFDRARDHRYPDKENTMPKHGDANVRPELPPIDAAGGWTSINGGGSLRRSARREAQQEQRQEQRGPRDPGNLFGSVFHNPVEEDAPSSGGGMAAQRGGTTHPAGPGASVHHNHPVEMAIHSGMSTGGVPEAGAPERGGSGGRNRPLKPKEGQGLPDYPAIPARFPNELLTDESPEKKKSPRNRKALPSTRDSATPTASPAADSIAMDEPDITRENLVLRDNGSVITEPAMFAGVPLEKVDESHPFWNPEWESLESLIRPQYEKWKAKLDGLRSDPQAVRHSIFLSNRQVNRGQNILDFLRDGSFHPFQFASREMIDKFYKHYINYDTIFRLINVHEELKKFDLDVTPLEWLRHRMHEVAMAQGDKFNLSKTTHDLYHDARLKQLREKHGFGNIGRPSGYKVSGKESTKSSTKSKVKKETTGQTPSSGRRRSRQSMTQGESDEAMSLSGTGEYLEPVSPRQAKRQRLSSTKREETSPRQGSPSLDADLDHDGYSSTDSYSNGRIMHLDFRVNQVKTRHSTTSPKVTQYWTWKPEMNQFEHQVLRDVHPNVSWGLYKKPLNFDIGLAEIKEARYSSDGLLVQVVTMDEARGDVLVSFKRERTKRRFLSFIRKKGVQIVKNSVNQLDSAWQSMQSDVIMDEA